MTKEEYRIAIHDVIYLAACAVNGDIPEAGKVQKMDLPCVLQAAKTHQLTSVADAALQSVGFRDEQFIQETAKAQRKTALMDFDRERLFSCLEREAIWYMPLKGCVLKDMYPRFGMRQMADNDILIDPERAADVKDIMENLGFTTKQFGAGVHDVYYKMPVSNFEIHTGLFAPSYKPALYMYYRDIKPRLIKDEGKQYGYHFNEEDLYIYMIAHEYKHYSGGGTGLRSFLDVYVYMLRYGDSMDWTYIEAEMRKLGLSEFEKQSRSLALHLFGKATLTEKEMAMLEYVTWSGAFGTTAHRTDNRVKELGGGLKGKARYIKNRLFIPMESVKEYYSVFYNHKTLLPFLPFWRIGKGLVINRKTIRSEIHSLMKK